MSAPQIWAGCESCYSNSRLVGVWLDAVAAADITAEEIHADSSVDPAVSGCEEFVCMDTDGLPTTGEPSLDEAARWGEIYEDVGPEMWDPLCAWVRSGAYTAEGSSDYPVVSDFEAAFCGTWSSFQAYAESLADEVGLLDGVPEDLQGYVDLERWGRDLAYDYSVVDGPDCTVYVFRNH